jgi:hypothetical protein
MKLEPSLGRGLSSNVEVDFFERSIESICLSLSSRVRGCQLKIIRNSS